MRAHILCSYMLVTTVIFGPSVALRAEHFDLSNTSIADIYSAIDAGALTGERLMELYLARIAAYDKSGPEINAIISLNPHALEEARALDLERKNKGPRSLLHGIPVVLKDNINSVGLPCTGGSIFLKGNIPASDAFIVRRLREAGAIILAKVNLGDFASDGTGRSSIGGQTRNPHNPSFTPAGSSGGTGAAVGAWFAPLGLGTDTGGSLRSPTSVNGLAGLKPTTGLLSRGGNIPTCLCFDSPGPMARTVYDVALSLGYMTGVDETDPATIASNGFLQRDYTQFLKKDALKGARLGVIRDVKGLDPEFDAIFENALRELQAAGAILIDPVNYPPHVLGARAGIVKVVCDTEVPEQFDLYYASLGKDFPHSLAELVRRSDEYLTNRTDKSAPFPKIYGQYKARLNGYPPRTSLAYRSAKEHGIAMVRDAVMGMLESNRIDALVYCTRSAPPEKVGVEPTPSAKGTIFSVRDIANITGFPDMIVPAGVTGDDIPATISFVGPAFSEPRLLGYAYAYEQATKHRTIAKATPPLPGESFDY